MMGFRALRSTEAYLPRTMADSRYMTRVTRALMVELTHAKSDPSFLTLTRMDSVTFESE